MTADIFDLSEYRRRREVRDAIVELQKSVREFDLPVDFRLWGKTSLADYGWQKLRSADLVDSVMETLKPDDVA